MCVDTLTTNHDQLGTLSICNQEFHTDINAAFSNRFPCMGRQSVSSGGRGTVTRPTGGVMAGIMATSQSHVPSRNDVPCSQRLMVTAIFKTASSAAGLANRKIVPITRTTERHVVNSSRDTLHFY